MLLDVWVRGGNIDLAKKNPRTESLAKIIQISVKNNPMPLRYLVCCIMEKK
jgi:hypothetical protein